MHVKHRASFDQNASGSRLGSGQNSPPREYRPGGAANREKTYEPLHSRRFSTQEIAGANGHMLLAGFPRPCLGYATAAYQVDDQNDQCDNQEQMDQPAGNMKAKTQKPQN
jgi:hypothetical protein